MTLNPDTIEGLLTLLTAVGVAAGAISLAVVKVINAVKEAVAELKGIRTDQKAADQIKVQQGQAVLAATPGAVPVTSADIARGTGDGTVRAAAVDLLESAPNPPPVDSNGVEDLGKKMDRLAAILERMAPPPEPVMRGE